MKQDDVATIELFKISVDLLKHEGNGIWARFNIVVGIEVLLFGTFGLIIRYGADKSEVLALAICLSGMAISIWGFRALRRLWQWHDHWGEIAFQIEKGFSSGTPLIFGLNQGMERIKPSRKKGSVRSTDTPMIIFFVLWAGAIIWLLSCALFPHVFG